MSFLSKANVAQKGYSRVYTHYQGALPLEKTNFGPEMRRVWCEGQPKGKACVLEDRVLVYPKWEQKAKMCFGGFSWSQSEFDGTTYDTDTALHRIPRESFQRIIGALNAALAARDRSDPSGAYHETLKIIMRRANTVFPFANFALHIHKYTRSLCDGILELQYHVLEIDIKKNAIDSLTEQQGKEVESRWAEAEVNVAKRRGAA
jgi:hypothetical protein